MKKILLIPMVIMSMFIIKSANAESNSITSLQTKQTIQKKAKKQPHKKKHHKKHKNTHSAPSPVTTTPPAKGQ
mgnify:CR=1 FL=1